MCAASSPTTSLLDRNGPASAASSTIASIVKPEGAKTKCLECDGYSCCCIPIPCSVM